MLDEYKAQLLSFEAQRYHEHRAINERLDAIEEIIIAHQGWTVLNNGERECHKSVRNLIDSIRNIVNTDAELIEMLAKTEVGNAS